MSETMTVHKALAELKILDGRIQKAIDNSIYCVANKHSNDKVNGVSIEEFKKTIQGCYDKATDLIKRQEAIKKAVTLSNAVTKVKVVDEEYTVAEAIWMRNQGIEFKRRLMFAMQNQYNKSQMVIKKENGKDLEDRADKYVEALYGTKEGKNSAENAEKTRQEFIANNSYELLDPINVLDKIGELEQKISEFMAEVDAELSKSNALTEITIDC